MAVRQLRISFSKAKGREDMSRQESHLKRARIASPCPVNWESMTGDDRARFCQECQLHVYNISEMTRQQAEDLMASTEGRICARLYRRADGTVLTKDCPVGLRALRRRLARAATAALTAILSVTASAFGQTWMRTGNDDSGNAAGSARVTRTFFGLNPQEGRASCFGVVKDPLDMPVAGARVTIINEKTKYEREIKTDDEGQFEFGLLEPGVYTLKIESTGFMGFVRDHLRLHSNEAMRLDVTLDVGTVGIVSVCEEPPIKGKGIIIDGVSVRINED
jgi:hypothetical protein